MIILIPLGALILLGIAAVRYGYDSRDGRDWQPDSSISLPLDSSREKANHY